MTQEELYTIIHENQIMCDAGVTFVVVDEHLRILYVNYQAMDDSLNLCPGDLLKCSNAVAAKGGCGTHENCSMCKLRGMVTKSLKTGEKMEVDTELLVGDNNDFSVHAVSTPFSHGGKQYAVVLLIDKTDRYREFMMERVFLHDLLNLSGALKGITDCMQYSDPKEMEELIKGISGQLMDEITAQRELIYAKNGKLKPKTARFGADKIISFVKENLSAVAKDMWNVTLKIGSTITNEQLDSDKALVNRVVHNMVKNACEANSGTVVTVAAHSENGKVVFSVHNDAVMPANVKNRIFIYGNSTKGNGRGLGTYSMKLIGENYLNGRVWFKSEEGFGTEFYFELDEAL